MEKARKKKGRGKKIINKILREFGYHLTKFPKPYKRKKKDGFGVETDLEKNVLIEQQAGEIIK